MSVPSATGSLIDVHAHRLRREIAAMPPLRMASTYSAFTDMAREDVEIARQARAAPIWVTGVKRA